MTDLLYALVSNLIFLAKTFSHYGDRYDFKNYGVGYTLELSLSQYICKQLQAFLDELRMHERLKISEQVQNDDSANPTYLLHYPRFSQDSFQHKSFFRLSISFIGVTKHDRFRWHRWGVRLLVLPFSFPLKYGKSFLMTSGERCHNPLSSLVGSQDIQTCFHK